MRSLFRYFGGKAQLAPWITSYFPPHEYYIEPFCGAASVFFQKHPAKYELLNDLNSDVVNIFRILQSEEKAARLVRQLYFTPYSREIYNSSFDADNNASDIDRAVRFLTIASMSFNADSVNGHNRNGFRGYFKSLDYKRFTIPAQDWANWINYLDFFCARLQGVLIENIDAFKIIEKYRDHADVFWYFDPPYVHSTRQNLNCKYHTELTDFEHESLVSKLLSIKGKVIISGYDCEIYSNFEAAGWKKYCRKVQKNYMKNIPLECIWSNFNQ